MTVYRGGNFFFFFLIKSGLKLDEKSIENGLEGQKCSGGCLFWGWSPPPSYRGGTEQLHFHCVVHGGNETS